MNKIVYALAATALIGCAKSQIELDVDNTNKPKTHLQLTLQTDGNAEFQSVTLPSPCSAYIFDMSGACVQNVAINSDNSDVELTEGKYKVYISAGATVNNITTPQDVIVESSIVKNDLLLANAEVTMTAGNDTQLELNLQRQVCMLKGITLTNIPDDISTVSVGLDNFYNTLTLDGQLNGYGGQVFVLSNTGNNTWSTSNACYFLPSKGNVVMTVTTIDSNNDATTYEVTLDQTFEANHKYSVVGDMEKKVNSAKLTISARCSEWQEDTEVTVSFGEANVKEIGTPVVTPSTGVPEVGTLYNGAYVVRSERQGSLSIVTLLSTTYAKKDKGSNAWVCNDKSYTVKDLTNQTAWDNCMQTLLPVITKDYVAAGVTDWRLPNEAEAQYMAEHWTDIASGLKANNCIVLSFTANFYMLIQQNGEYQMYDTLKKTAKTLDTNVMYLRPVTTVTFQ